MANSPDFHWHITNLRNYINVSPKQQSKVYWENVYLTPFGQAAGTINLPGGFTSPERFVRTAFLKTHTEIPKNRFKAIMTCFHIMNSVSIPKGIVLTKKEIFNTLINAQIMKISFLYCTFKIYLSILDILTTVST